MAVRELVELVARVTDLERRVSGLLRHGRVAEVDMDMFRVRLDLGPAHGTGGRFLSPWVPYAQQAGALRVHTPPDIGQQFTLISPTGDFQQAVAVPLHWSSSVPSPSDRKDENVIQYGAVRIELREGELVVRVGQMAFVVNEQGIRIQNGRLEVDGGILDHGGVLSTASVWPLGPVSVAGVSGPGNTGGEKVPARVPGTE
jgi:phage baseplate assembly protein gpV